MSQLGANIQKEREAAGLDREELADKLGLKAITIRRYEEYGSGTMRLQRVIDIARAIGCPPHRLLKGTSKDAQPA